MTKSAKLWVLIVLISGESLSQDLNNIQHRDACLLVTSMSVCGHHMAEYALDLAMIIWRTALT